MEGPRCSTTNVLLGGNQDVQRDMGTHTGNKDPVEMQSSGHMQARENGFVGKQTCGP
jgi:hypothetical protein